MRANYALATAAALFAGCSGVLGAALEKQDGTPGKHSPFSHSSSSSSSSSGRDDGSDSSTTPRVAFSTPLEEEMRRILGLRKEVQHNNRVATIKEVAKVTSYDNRISKQHHSTSDDRDSRC